jgi:hypothetical protein
MSHRTHYQDGDIVEVSLALKHPGNRERLLGLFLPTLQVLLLY